MPKKIEKKFKVKEVNAKDAPIKNIEWEGEELQAYSTTKITDDVGKGQPVILRTFKFAANPEAFRMHKPTAQELFESHKRGIEALLWRDGLTHFREVEPRIVFTKDQKTYTFIIACIPTQALIDNPKTLSELLTNKDATANNTNTLRGELPISTS